MFLQLLKNQLFVLMILLVALSLKELLPVKETKAKKGGYPKENKTGSPKLRIWNCRAKKAEEYK